MTNLTQTTKSIKEAEVKRTWHLIDVSGKVLGRIAPEIAKILQGKHKVNYVSYLDSGDYVVVINAKKVVVTGKKAETKTYSRYSGYPGGLKITSYKTMMEKDPGAIIEHAVSGMLPKNKHRDDRMRRMYVYGDNKHPYIDKFEARNTKS